MKYFYSGPFTGVTLQNGSKAQEVMLHTNTNVDLPKDNEYTQTLLALGHLKLAAEEAPAAEAPVKTGKKGD